MLGLNLDWLHTRGTYEKPNSAMEMGQAGAARRSDKEAEGGGTTLEGGDAMLALLLFVLLLTQQHRFLAYAGLIDGLGMLRTRCPGH